MKTAIHYLKHTPQESDGFYHAACPVLFAEHDTVTTLADCPFPLKTDSFRVLLFGTTKSQPDDVVKGYGHTKRFAVVEFEKACGHLVQERISFIEGVQTFTSHGTTFTGESYSIADWERRIEYFRNSQCDVCKLVSHSLWTWSEGLSESNRPKTVASLRHCLDYNFANWQDFVNWADIERRFKATKRGSREIAA